MFQYGSSQPFTLHRTECFIIIFRQMFKTIEPEITYRKIQFIRIFEKAQYSFNMIAVDMRYYHEIEMTFSFRKLINHLFKYIPGAGCTTVNQYTMCITRCSIFYPYAITKFGGQKVQGNGHTIII